MDGARPDDTALSTFFASQSSDDRYFTEQALRAGFFGDSKMSSDTYSLREEIQRQIEKDRIREEIIASEIVRRRELEAEVRRELELERDLAMQREGFPLFGKSWLGSSMWSDQRVSTIGGSGGLGPFGNAAERVVPGEVGVSHRLPFQRNPEAAKIVGEGSKAQGGDQVTNLVKPMTTILAGSRRKADTDLVVSGLKKRKPEHEWKCATLQAKPNSASLVGSKSKAATDIVTNGLKKADQEWNCALCQVSATSEQGLNQHFLGRKHKAREFALRSKTAVARKAGNASPPEKASKPIKFIKNKLIADPNKQKTQEVSVMQKLNAEEKKKIRFKYWCADCKIGCHSEKVMNNHVKGKKHSSRMQSLMQVDVSPARASNESADRKECNTYEEVNGEDGLLKLKEEDDYSKPNEEDGNSKLNEEDAHMTKSLVFAINEMVGVKEMKRDEEEMNEKYVKNVKKEVVGMEEMEEKGEEDATSSELPLDEVVLIKDMKKEDDKTKAVASWSMQWPNVHGKGFQR